MNESTTDGPRSEAPQAGGDAAGGTFRLLFVCTGNTCRSPMAEAIARDLLHRHGVPGVEVRSAGVGAYPGAQPSGGAVRVAEARGIDLSGHRATLLTRREIEWADLILTMSPHHLVRVGELGGGARAALLTAFAEGNGGRAGGAIPDPIGGSDREYDLTYRRLETLIEKALARIPAEAPE